VNRALCLALLGLAVVVLPACGGGGGGDNRNDVATRIERQTDATSACLRKMGHDVKDGPALKVVPWLPSTLTYVPLPFVSKTVRPPVLAVRWFEGGNSGYEYIWFSPTVDDAESWLKDERRFGQVARIGNVVYDRDEFLQGHAIFRNIPRCIRASL
jgi:hypothetical protein